MTGDTESGKRTRVYTVFATGLLLAAFVAVGSVGAITASGATATVNAGPPGNLPAPVDPPAGPPFTVNFAGCDEAVVVFESAVSDALPVTATVNPSGGSETVTITGSDLTTRPGEYGAHPVYRLEGVSGEGILGVELSGEGFDSTLVANPNQCSADGRPS